MAIPEPTADGVRVAAAHALTVNALRWSAPWHWLAAGARDVQRAWGVALFYGLCFWGMAQLLLWVFQSVPHYTMSMVSGCLLIGPFLAMGLYDTSRRLAHGHAPDLGQSITCWDRHLSSMGMLVFVLVVLELLWGRASLVVFAVFFHTGMPSTTGVLQAILHPDNWQFLLAYALVGGIFAGVVFGGTVVALPLILDRGTDALTAVITSFRVVAHQPAVLLLWAALIVALLAAAMVSPWQLPLVLVGPWLGCATWHAYCASVVHGGIDCNN
jgi:uncharacterized membrane protein